MNAGTVSSLRLRGRGRPCYNLIEIEGRHVDVWRKYPFHGAGADHPVLRRHARVREVHRPHRGRGHLAAMRALALIDGEHYADVVVAAFARAAVRGRRRGRARRDGEAPRRRGLRRAALRVARARGSREAGAEVVVDLSDEPVVTARDRMRAREPRRSRRGCRTSAPTSASTRSTFAPFELPSLAVIGSGKRVGKTAVAGHLARLLAETRDVVVVAMGRGGPPEPVVVEEPPDAATRSSSSRAPDPTPPPTTSRTPRSPACPRSAAGAAAAGSPARRSSRTSRRAPAPPPSSARTS